jgi:hypothetical protein
MSTYLDIAKQVETLLHNAPACVADTPTSTEVAPAGDPCGGGAATVQWAPTPVAMLTEVGPALRSFREWVTGSLPSTATTPMKTPLPAPKYRDHPSPCRSYIGRACPKRACQGDRRRFARTGMCVRCWERAAKVTCAHEVNSR